MEHCTQNDNYALLMVPKGRRWRVNNGGTKAFFIKEVGITSFKKSFQKLWYLLASSPHCPYHKHLEVVKVKVAKLEYMLDEV